ncbi:hypothetical protein [Mumia sp. DW29H23]|uniref:hypothetical protein n=1 Tax=Mumia sp. DW29H23 TaxID=3421241 RepID=UPI003D68D377
MLRSTGAVVGAILGGLAAIALALVVGVYGFGWFSQQSAGFRGETSKRNLVEANGAYRIAAYDSFFDRCASVQATEDSIRVQLEEMATASPERKQQIAANVTASRAVRAQAIRRYNTDAAKTYTSGQFLSSDLPYQLDINAKETSCTA